MSAFTIGSVQVQVYGLLLAVGAAAALCWAMARCRGMKEHTVLCFALFALPLGFLLARLGQCLVSQGWYLFRENYFFNFRRGGFMLYGAMGGTVLAAWIASKITRQSFGRLLDAVSAPGMLVIAVCRFAEGIIGVGYGRAMEDWFDPWGEFTFFPMEDPETVLLIDQWRDQSAIDGHHASPMMAQLAALREKYDLHMTVERFVSDDIGSDEKYIRK